MIRPSAILLACLTHCLTLGLTLGLTLCLGTIAGCSTASTSSQPLLKVAAPPPPAASNPDDPTPPMSDREVVHFDIESFNGDVMIEADPKAKEMTVSWLREAKHGATRGSEARAALNDISADVQTVDDERGRTIVIRVTTTNPEPHFLRANLSIKAPAVGDVRIRTSRGKVYVSDSQGEAFIETTEGDVRLMTHWPVHTPMTILNAQGAIDYRVRAESTGRFDCHSVGNKIFFRQRYGRWTMNEPGTTHDRVVAVLNEGTNPITLRTVDGKIRIAVVPDPTVTGTFIIDP